VNHRKKMKAEPNRLIPLKPMANLLELSNVVGLFVYHLEGLSVPLLVRVPQFETDYLNSRVNGRLVH